MFKFFNATRSEKIGQFTAHLLMFLCSVFVLYLHCTSYNFYFMYIEYSEACVLLDIGGVITGLGGMVILIRGYINPKHRF